MRTKPPNLLVIMADQHRADVMACAGHRHVHTPHLDELAGRGMRFTDAYCNNPMCVPSRLSFLSGKTTNELGVWSLSDAMRSDELTWPALLGSAGYDTAISGRMHHWWPDKLHGFHQRLYGETATRVAARTYAIYEPGPRQVEQAMLFKSEFKNEMAPGNTGPGQHGGYQKDQASTAAAVAFLESRRGDAPFALCVGYLCPHSPMRFDAAYYDRYRDTPVDLEAFDATLPAIWQVFAENTGFDQPMDAKSAREAVRAYYAMVSYVDDQVGQLIAALKRRGLFDDTVILYTSDHGEMLGQRGLWFKNQLLEPAIRVPLLVCGPDVAASKTCSTPVSLLDLFPTLGEIGRAAPWSEAAGRSLVPLLRGQADASFQDRPVFIEYADYGIGQPAACIRSGRYKLVAARGFDPVLFDLEADPRETTNRHADPALSKTVQRLERELARFWNPEDTYRRVVSNQKRIDLIRRSRVLAMDRGMVLDGGITG